MKRKIFYMGCLCAILLSCGQREQAGNDIIAANDLFDLHSYVGELIERYESGAVRVNKQISLNDNSELLENLEVDWKTELQPLRQAHINRSAWLDKFKVDTLKNNNGYVVTYRTDHPPIPVRELEVSFDVNNAVKTIRVETRRKNLLYNSKQVIDLVPDVSYRVDGSQRALFLSRTKFKVDSYLLMGPDTIDAKQVE